MLILCFVFIAFLNLMSTNFQNVAECIEHVIAIKGRKLMVGTPLGIGKPNQLLNEIWKKAKAEPDLYLEIFTALSLQVPDAHSLLEKRFLNPFVKAYFPDYPDLDYIQDVKNNRVPGKYETDGILHAVGKNVGFFKCTKKLY